jgi:uncharacterized CHY-type Zn-finger protein
MSKLRELARGQQCQLRIPGVCCFNTETTVLAHIRRNIAGLSIKPSDLCAVWACHKCHDEIDGRGASRFNPEEIDSFILAALLRQLLWYETHEVLNVCL